jgi:hypothetical protein
MIPSCVLPQFGLPKRGFYSNYSFSNANNLNVSQIQTEGQLKPSDSAYSSVITLVHNFWQIEDPGGQQVHIIKQRMQAKYNLTAIRKGPYKFCFQNRVSMLQTVDFNVHIGHLTRDEPVKDGE